MKLIKINTDHYVIVDDSEIKEGDWVLTKENTVHQVDYVDAYTKINNWSKITHSTQPLYKNDFWAIQELKLPEVKELIGEVDVEKMGYNESFRRDVLYNQHSTIGEQNAFIDGTNYGYNQCFEEYTKSIHEILDHLIDKMDSISQEMIDKDPLQLGRYRTFKYVFDYIKSSTQPKTEWEVEFVKQKQTTPYISDDFQIGPDGAFEHEDDLKDWDNTLNDGLENE